MQRSMTWGLVVAAGLFMAGCPSSEPTDAGIDGDVVDAPDVPVDTGPDTVVPRTLALAPGEVAELPSATGRAGIRLATPMGNERYVVVLASTAFDSTSGSDFGYTLDTTGAPEGATGTVLRTCSLDDSRWRTVTPPVETPPSGTTVAVGAERMLDISLNTGARHIMVRALAVSDRAVVWADITPTSTAMIDTTFATQFLADFDNIILPRERSIFGVESDLDHDGHIHLVFSPLTYQVAIAFFHGCDLQRTAGCAASNMGEYLYLSPLNVLPTYMRTAAAVKETLSHELQHMIHFNRKVLRNHLTVWPDNGYLLEGFAALAQDVIGYQSGNLFVVQSGLESVNEFSFVDVLPNGGQYTGDTRDGVLRGGAYLFSRWLYDRAGGDAVAMDGAITGRGGPAFIRTILDTVPSVVDQLPMLGSTTMGTIAMDFYTALAMSNRDQDMAGGVAPANACFSYLPTATDPLTMKQRGTNLFGTLPRPDQRLAGPHLQPITEADGTLLAGGVEYFLLEAAAGTPEMAFTVETDPGALPRVRVGRIR